MMGVPGGPPPPEAPYDELVNEICVKMVLKFMLYVQDDMLCSVLTPYAPGDGDE